MVLQFAGREKRQAFELITAAGQVRRRGPNSTIDVALRGFGITSALNLYLGRCIIDLAKVLVRQFDVHRHKVLLKSMQLCRAGDGDHPRLLG